MHALLRSDALALEPPRSIVGANDDVCALEPRRGLDVLCADTPGQLTAHPLWQRPVRYYVSTVTYEGGMLVHDGLDDVLNVCFA